MAGILGQETPSRIVIASFASFTGEGVEVRQFMDASNLFFWIPILACGAAAAFDLRSREIPNRLALGLLVLLPLKVVLADSDASWWIHIGGGLMALLLASIAGYGDRFGGGDIKLFAALGAWFGLFAVVPLALWIALAGLPLALFAALRKQQDFAYAPAIFLGVCVHVLNPDLLHRLVSA